MPNNAVLFWRDNSTRKALTAYDTLDELIAAKPDQVIEFNDDTFLLANVQEEQQNNTSNDSHYDSGSADPIVEKQYNGSFGRTLVLTIISDVDQTVLRQKLTSFVNKIQIEPAYHEFGIFGFYHPKLADFNVDPTNLFGYTIDRPLKGYVSGSEHVPITLRLSLGGNQKLAGP